jgi:ceramide glucosyltransferase
VQTVLDATSPRDVWRHQVRWARTYRACQPSGWFLAVLVQLMTWATLFWFAAGGTRVATAMLLGALAVRALTAASVTLRLHEGALPRFFWLLPLKDLAMSAIWIVSWLGRDVVWAGQRFRIEPDGRLVRLPARAYPERPLAAPSP